MKNVPASIVTRHGNRRPRLTHSHRAAMQMVRRLLDAGSDLAKRREALAGLRELVAADEHETRRRTNYSAWRRGMPERSGRRRDLNIADELLGDGRLSDPTVEEIAARFRVSVAHVEDLRVRLFRHLAGPVAKPTRGAYPEASSANTDRKAA